jgi:hypothetical protein
MITWASFLYIGSRSRRRDWLIAGVVYAIAIGVVFYFTAGTEGPNGKPNQWLGGAIIALWIAGIVHALLSRPIWLQWRANNTVPWYLKQQENWVAAPIHNASGFRNTLPPELSGMGLDSARYYTPRPASPLGPPPGSLSAPPATTGIQAPDEAHPAAGHQTEPLEVNTARADQLASLPGFNDQRVRAVVAARDSRGGFSDIEQFADAASLAPHERYRIRGLVTVTPLLTGWPKPSGAGRVVDL